MKKTFRQQRRTAPGATPGTLVPDPQAPHPRLRLISYSAEKIDDVVLNDPVQIKSYLGQQPVVWVNVEGLGDAEVIRQLGEIFGLHQLALEDVVNTHQRPKVEEYDDHVFIVSRMLSTGKAYESKQITLFLGKNYVLTFQEQSGDCLDPVRERLQREYSRLRQNGADYLAYALLDAIIDAYFPVLESHGESIEALEDAVLDKPDTALIGAIHQFKRELLALRRTLWPQREMLNTLIREDCPLIRPQTRPYLRDCYDHTVQLIDLIEIYREIASGLVDVYLSSVSSHMNEVMKVLTIIATIFIPLSFIAGIYGMNFDPEKSPWNMPELAWYFGYPFALTLMAVLALGLLWYFRRKGWIGRP